MEEITVSDITNITRQAGKVLFIHGEFGTRAIRWSDKQKRDECLAALERARGKKLGSFDKGQ